MLIQINDHIQLDSSIGLDFKPDETYGDKIVIDDDELLIHEEEANSIENDKRPDDERPIQTLHRRSGEGWQYFRISSEPIAEMMAKGKHESIAGLINIKQVGLALCVETGPDTLLTVFRPVGFRTDSWDEYYSVFDRMIKIAKSLVINGERLNLSIANSDEIANKIRPEFGPPIEDRIDICPVVKAKVPLNITITPM